MGGRPRRQERSAKTVRIPHNLLHIELDDLTQSARAALRPLLADLPLVPDASHSAVLVGPARATLLCLAVLARHVGQGLRDHNLSLTHDRQRLTAERCKLIFLESAALAELLSTGDGRLQHEAVLFVIEPTPGVLDLLAKREANGLASFVTSTQPPAGLRHWRHMHLEA